MNTNLKSQIEIYQSLPIIAKTIVQIMAHACCPSIYYWNLQESRTKKDLADSLLEGANLAGKLSREEIMELLQKI